MFAKSSSLPAWEQLKLPNDLYSLICQAQISDDCLVMLISTPSDTIEMNMGYQTTTRNLCFMLLDTKTMKFSVIEDKANAMELLKNTHSFRMLCEENILVAFKVESNQATFFKCELSPDHRSILSCVQKSCFLFGPSSFDSNILYKQNIYYYGSEQHQISSQYGQLLMIDTNTGNCIEHKFQGSNPGLRSGHCTTLHRNQMFLFGGGLLARQNHGPILRDMWVLDLDKLVWNEITCPVSPLPKSMASVGSVDNKIYLFGGKIPENPGYVGNIPQFSKDLYVYNIDMNEWKLIETDQKGLPDITNGAPKLTPLKDKLFLQSNNNTYFLSLKDAENKKKQKHAAVENLDLAAKQKAFFVERPFPDIVFKVEGKEIPAHKGVLYSYASFFKNMFSSGMEESNKKNIEVSGTKARVFEALLEYIYCTTVEIDHDIAWELLEEAEKYLLPQLKQICADFLINNINAKNVVDTINCAERFEVADLRSAGLKYMANNMDKVFEETDVYQLKKSTMLEAINMKR